MSVAAAPSGCPMGAEARVESACLLGGRGCFVRQPAGPAASGSRQFLIRPAAYVPASPDTGRVEVSWTSPESVQPVRAGQTACRTAQELLLELGGSLHTVSAVHHREVPAEV